jgi:hypothetical protein
VLGAQGPVDLPLNAPFAFCDVPAAPMVDSKHAPPLACSCTRRGSGGAGIPSGRPTSPARQHGSVPQDAAGAAALASTVGGGPHPSQRQMPPGGARARARQRAAWNPASAGRLNANVVPAPGCRSTHRRPPWLSTIERLIARPMPMPCGLVV